MATMMPVWIMRIIVAMMTMTATMIQATVIVIAVAMTIMISNILH